MDFTFSEEQVSMRDTVSRYLQRAYTFDARQSIVHSAAGWSADVWRALVELGLVGLPFPEPAGGLGGSIVDLVAVSELFGEHLLVEPYAAAMMAGAALAAVPDHAGAAARLTRLVAGESLAAFAHEEGRGTPDPALIATCARPTAGGYVLTGDKRLVLHGADAQILVVTARLTGRPGESEGLALFVVDAPAHGLTVRPLVTVDGRRAADVRFEDTELGSDALLASDALADIRRIVDRAVLVLAAEAVGAMGALLRRTSEYARTREQFGVPIGSFQAVGHRLADMKIDVVTARASLLYTAALAEAGVVQQRDIAVLKAQVGRLGRRVGESAIQTHGGIGMTDELPIGHLHKRILAFDAMFGATDHHLRTIGAPPVG